MVSGILQPRRDRESIPCTCIIGACKLYGTNLLTGLLQDFLATGTQSVARAL